MGIKELFEPIVWWEKRRFLLFLKTLSWETDRLVTLRNFKVKNRKFGMGNLYLIEID